MSCSLNAPDRRFLLECSSSNPLQRGQGIWGKQVWRSNYNNDFIMQKMWPNAHYKETHAASGCSRVYFTAGWPRSGQHWKGQLTRSKVKPQRVATEVRKGTRGHTLRRHNTLTAGAIVTIDPLLQIGWRRQKACSLDDTHTPSPSVSRSQMRSFRWEAKQDISVRQ